MLDTKIHDLHNMILEANAAIADMKRHCIDSVTVTETELFLNRCEQQLDQLVAEFIRKE